METQAWSSQPVQAAAPGGPSQPLIPSQSTVSGPPDSWVPPNTPPSQSQGQPQTTFSSSHAQGYPPSPAPTFSYNGTSASSCSTESPKQSLSSNANSPKMAQGGAFASPASVPSPQPPVPGQSPVLGPPSSWGPPGAPVNSSHIPPRLTFTVPAAYPSSSTMQFSYAGSSQPSSGTESPQQCQTTSMTTSTGMVKVGPHLPHASSSAQSTSIPIYATSHALPPAPLLPFQAPNNYSALRWQPQQPSPASPPTPSGPPGMAVPTTSTLSQAQSAPPLQQSGPPAPPGPPGMPVSTTSILTLTHTAPSPRPSGPPAPPGPPGIPVSTSTLTQTHSAPSPWPSGPPVPPVPPGIPVSTSTLTQTQSASAPQPSQPGPSAPPGTLEISVSTTSIANALQPPPPGQSAAPGPPGISVSTTSTSTEVHSAPNSNGETASTVQTALATPSSSMPNPTMTNLTQHIQPVGYQTYPPGPPLGAPPQVPWMHPPQFGGLPRPPFVPYPGGFPGSYSAPPRPVGLPQGAAPPPSHPPGTSPLGPPGASTAKAASGQTLGNFGTQLPPGVSVAMSFSAQRVEAPSQINTSNQHVSTMASLKAGLQDKEKQGNEQTNKEEQILRNVEADSWTAHKTESGEIYYYNALTGDSTYEKPPGFKGEPEKVTLQPTPVSCEKLSGTAWALVTTNDGKKYYYNTKNQATSWQVPPEVADIRKKQLQEASAKLTANSGQIANTAEKGPISFSLNVPAASTGGRESMGHKVSSTAALDLIKKKLQDSGAPGAPMTTLSNTGPASGTSNANGTTMVEAGGKTQQSESNKEKSKGTVTEGALSDSTSDSDDEDSGPTKEERVLQFKDMLKEKGVAPFSKWEKELPKIIFDPRFKAIPSYTERRSIFEHYVRTRADEERKEKRAAQKAAVEGFKHLLEEASEDITHKTDYDSFAKKWSRDPRFEALDRKERESLLNERVLPLRRAVEEKVKAIQAASVASFKAMLRENGDINSNSRWSRVKDSLRSDSRYKAVKREDREALFNEYVSELRAAEEEAEWAAKAKREEEDKLKERKREMLKRKEREEHEMERVRSKARRKDAVTSYQALLTEKIKDPEASWTEARPKLEKDPLGRANNPELDLAERERLFREHLNGLYERCVRDYRSLLADVIVVDATTKHLEEGKNILTSWSEAKRLLKPDPRYAKMPRRERELWWRRYAEDVQRRLKLTASDRNENKPNTDDGLKLTSADGVKRSPASRRNTSRR